MYYPNQIVYDLDAKTPVKIGDDVWDKASYVLRSTHFLKSGRDDLNGETYRRGQDYVVACPASIEDALDLLDKGLIFPAPAPESHCWFCRNWKQNCSCPHKGREIAAKARLR